MAQTMSCPAAPSQPALRTTSAAVEAVNAAVAVALARDWDIDVGGWQMAPDALAFLDALVTELAPRHIIEFGSGTSTAVLASAAQRSQRRTHITSIDNDPDAQHATRRLLSDAEETGAVTVEVVFAPIVVRRVDGRHCPVYLVDPATLSSHPAPDLVIVDGPPSHLGGREGALPQALALAVPGTIVVLDDADRPGEHDTFDVVTRNHHTQVQPIDCEGFARGLAVLVVTAPTTVTFGDDAPHGPDTEPRNGDTACSTQATTAGEKTST